MRGWIRAALLALVLLLGLFLLLGYVVFSAPPYRGPASDHFDGRRFFNQPPIDHGRADFLRWMAKRERGTWSDWVATEPGPPPPARVTDGRLRVTFVNHSTVLVQMDGVNLLTDPIWSRRAGPVPWAGVRRRRPPGIRFEDLPPIDAVVVSHNHYDHLDLPTLRRLAAAHDPRIYVPLGNAALLKRKGVAGASDLDWWKSAELRPGVRIHAVPARHFSMRGLGDRDRTLWSGFVLEGPSGLVYFAGDTGFGAHFAEIRRRFGVPRLALLPIGAYRPRWFMREVHLDPAEAIRAHQELGAATSMGIHFGTFPQADDGELEPIEDLQAALAPLPVEERARFWLPEFGAGREVPALDRAAAPQAAPER